MLNRLLLITFYIGIVFVAYRACARDYNPVEITTTCSPDNFTEGNCTLTCSYTTNSFLHYWSWNYFTTSENDSIEIYYGVELTYNDSTYSSSLTLDDYNAGTYQCLFYIYGDRYSATVKISQAENGSKINERCVEDHDCYALNATCTTIDVNESVCQCSGQYNITYNTGGDTLACLKLQPKGGHCYSQSECDWPTQVYKCIDSQCKCQDEHHEFEIDETGMEMCIEPADFNEDCYYDEQCDLLTPDSYCYDAADGTKSCKCQSGYKTKVSDQTGEVRCYDHYFGKGEIASIVIGVILGTAGIIAGLVYIIKEIKKSY